MTYVSKIEGVFDYIVIGGGSAGCVVANRLTEDPQCRVLLLEAGGDARNPLVELPFGFAMLLDNPKFDWRFAHGPEPSLGGRELPFPRGKAIGGSSSINAMLYARGLKRDYDAWRAEGLPGWGWDEVEPYFRKLEDYREASPATRGRGGPLTVMQSPNWHPLSEKVLEAAGQSRVGRSEDYNQPEPTGLGKGQIFFRNGRRCGSALAYIRPAEGRLNLHIATGTLAIKLLFEGRRAMGVQYRRGERTGTVSARSEVILCAGTVGSPQLLEVSGIGDAERLRKLGIQVRHDLPAVGEHMQDHYLVYVVQTLHGIQGLGREISGWRGVLAALNATLFRRGYLSGTPSQLSGHATVDVDGVRETVQFIGSPLRFSRDAEKKAVVLHTDPALMLGAYLGNPKSRGSVHAATPSIDDKPRIVANFLADERDVRGTIAALKLCREIVAQPALAPFREREIAPGPAADLDQYIRAAWASGYHPVGTCRMASNARDGVVDAELKVHGIAGLRVVDASVMPRLVTGNTYGPTVMIGEKAATLIRAERTWRPLRSSIGGRAIARVEADIRGSTSS